MVVLLIILVVAGAGYCGWKFLVVDSAPAVIQFDKKRQFLSRHQIIFLDALQKALHASSLAFVRIPIDELLLSRTVSSGSEKDSTALSLLRQTVDFVICSKADGEVLAVIDLIDNDGDQVAHVVEQNLYRRNAFTSARIPYAQVGVQAYYAPVDVEELLAQLFEQSYERKEPAEEKVTLDVAS